MLRKLTGGALALLMLTAAPAIAGDDDDGKTDGAAVVSDSEQANKASGKKGSPVKVHYKRGFHIESADGNYATKMNFRAQLRLTDLSSPDLVGEEDGVEEESGFRIRRARFKMKGHIYRPWLKYKFEYGLEGNVLLTWSFDVALLEQATLRAGQWKVLYNRERVDSSGKQQFVDRSIVNSPFTVDRQQGLSLQGRLFKGTRGSSEYAAGVFTGTGRGGELDGDRRPMYSARWQWNFLKRPLPFSQSDIERHQKAAASLALAASSNVSAYTRFSSSGGGQIPGFSDGQQEQYKIQQWMAEYSHKYRGLSVQAEYHQKRIDDRVNQQVSELRGFYAQLGYFFSERFRKFPKPLELAWRVAAVDSTQGVELPADREATMALNWFFFGHDNKLTADVSYLMSEGELGTEDTGWRARFQWDVSF